MKPQLPALRFTFLLLASLVATCASALYSSTVFLPAQEVGIVNINNRDYRYITVWGAPFHFVYDMLNSQNIGQIDALDRFSTFAFLADWLTWFLVAWPLSYIIPNLYRFLVRFAREFANPAQEK